MLLPAVAIGFHGCDQKVGEKVLSGSQEIRPSKNPYDWLGRGGGGMRWILLLWGICWVALGGAVAEGAPGVAEQEGRPTLGVIRWDMYTEHPEKCPARTVIMYAWNEHSEGGFLCPTMGDAPDYRPVTKQVDELGKALREWTPSRKVPVASPTP